VMVAVVVAVAVFGVHLGMLVPGDLDQVVPVHNRANLVLETVLLLDFLVRCRHDALVFHLLAGSLRAVVKEREASLLGLVLADLVLLDSALLLLAYPADIEFLGFDLATLLDFLLVRQHEQLLRHAHLIDRLHVHGATMRHQPALVTHH